MTRVGEIDILTCNADAQISPAFSRQSIRKTRAEFLNFVFAQATTPGHSLSVFEERVPSAARLKPRLSARKRRGHDSFPVIKRPKLASDITWILRAQARNYLATGPPYHPVVDFGKGRCFVAGRPILSWAFPSRGFFLHIALLEISIALVRAMVVAKFARAANLHAHNAHFI